MTIARVTAALFGIWLALGGMVEVSAYHKRELARQQRAQAVVEANAAKLMRFADGCIRGEPSPIDKMIRLRCTHTGCPRTRKVAWDGTMPVGTTTIKSACPWHAGDTTTEDYYDAGGRWYSPDGWVEQSNGKVEGAEGCLQPEAPSPTQGSASCEDWLSGEEMGAPSTAAAFAMGATRRG